MFFDGDDIYYTFLGIRKFGSKRNLYIYMYKKVAQGLGLKLRPQRKVVGTEELNNRDFPRQYNKDLVMVIYKHLHKIYKHTIQTLY